MPCHPSVALSSILPALFTGIAFVVAVRRLPMLHPVQIWTGSWALATVLYALRLLPYRNLSWLTAGLICGSVLAFAAGALLGTRLAARRRVPRGVREDVQAVESAAWLSTGLLAVTLTAFMAQLVSRFGVTRVLRVSPDVKAYLAGGEAPLSGTYVDVAIAATAICALAGGLAESKAHRRRWLLAAAVSAGTVYFSTGRAFIAVAVIAGLAALLATKMTVDRRRLVATVVAAGLAGIVIFIGLGAALGKTYGNSGIGEFDNFFSRHPAVSWLALPYQDTTAGIPALDLLAGGSSTWGTAHGCATAPIPCGLLRKLGVPAERVPVTGPFTKSPLQWNGYTSLDRFLIDGGTALALALVAVLGLLAGYLWARARAGSTAAVIIYAVSVPSLVFAYRQNLIAQATVVAVIGVGLLLLGRLLSGFRAMLTRPAGWTT
jgi:oligosaccharide repeat unit polymerase